MTEGDPPPRSAEPPEGRGATGGRAAALAWLAVIAPLWLVMVACTHWEPVAFDGWNSAFFHRSSDIDGAAVWDLLHYGWRYANPRLGQTVTVLLYTPGPYHEIVTPLLELALFWLMTALVLGRLPSPRRAGDALAFATTFAIIAACTPLFGPMLFYRPYTGNYLFGLLVNVAWLVPYRLHLAAPRAWGWWWVPLMLVLGFAAGMCNEHTGPSFLALGGLAVAVSVRRGGVRAWMLAGLAGLLAGFLCLLLAPGNDLRYDGVAQQTGMIGRILERGVLENLQIPAVLAAYVAFALPWIALGLVARRRAPAAGGGGPGGPGGPGSPGPGPGREERLAWLAFGAAGVLAMLALFASPKIGARLYFAPVALIAVGIAGWLLAHLASARLRLACALLSGAMIVYVEVRCLAAHAQAGPAGAARFALIQAAPEGSAVTVPRLPVARSNWFIGDDLVVETRRAVVAARYGLGRIDLVPEQ